MIPVLALGLALALPGNSTDTTWTVQRGDRLWLENFSGHLSVESWNRDEILVEGEHGRRLRLEVSRDGEHVRVNGRRRGSRTIMVPTWMPVDITGVSLEVSVSGLGAGVSVETVEGNISVRDVKGPVTATTVDDEVRVVGVRGAVHVRSSGDDVFIEDVHGPVRAESVGGDLRVLDVVAPSVFARTVDGEVEFSGSLQSGGEYDLVTHDGDITMRLAGEPDAAFVVSTFAGEFSAEFPIRAERFRGAKDLRFTMGSGGARVNLEAFDGAIRLMRVH